jgi:hypothetical protein
MFEDLCVAAPLVSAAQTAAAPHHIRHSEHTHDEQEHDYQWIH